MNAPEVWRWIPGYEQFYEVSNLGQVRSYHSNNHRPTQPRLSLVPRILHQGTQGKKGYKSVVLCLIGEKKKTRLVHQLVAATFIGERPKDYDINHINGITDDNRVENLEYCTRQQNIRHKIDVLHKSRGEGMHNSKLKEWQALEILRLDRINSLNAKELAKQWGVHPDTIYAIKSGKNWKYLPR